MNQWMATWPIDDYDAEQGELEAAAMEDLFEQLDDAQMCATGPVRFERRYSRLTAVVSVQPLDSAHGDNRPWTSRQALADDLLGEQFSYVQLVAERFQLHRRRG